MEKDGAIGEKAKYDKWHISYPLVFDSQIAALKNMIQKNGRSKSYLEIGSGLPLLPKLIDIDSVEYLHFNSKNEKLPIADKTIDCILKASGFSSFNDLNVIFKESFRVLKDNGSFIIGFIDKDCLEKYDNKFIESNNSFNDFNVDKVIFELNRAGFRNFTFRQTLFEPPNEIQSVEVASGFGNGCFVVILAHKGDKGISLSSHF